MVSFNCRSLKVEGTLKLLAQFPSIFFERNSGDRAVKRSVYQYI